MSDAPSPAPLPDPPPLRGNSRAADQQLLFGALALQVRFIRDSDLIAALVQWVADKSQTLEGILLQTGKLNADRVNALRTLVAVHLQDHQGDCAASLRATGIDRERLLLPVEDPDLAESMRQLPAAELRPPPQTPPQQTPPLTLVAPPTTPPLSSPTPTSSAAISFDTESLHRSPSDSSLGTGSRYRIVRHHRDGGQGRVYVARDTELHRRVALKEPRPDRSDEQTCQRLMLEAEITGGLEHPGVVPIYGLSRHPDGRPYYTMKFIEGTTFWDEIKQHHSPVSNAASATARAASAAAASEGALVFRKLLQRFVDICNAVAYAHSRKVIHRDLKPQNVMLGKYGETLVVDWGMAKTEVTISRTSSGFDQLPNDEQTLRPTSGSSIEATSADAIVGTLRWMSPEQAAGRTDQLGIASDIYSLGAVLYCVLTGQPPYMQEHRDQVLKANAASEFDPPRSLKPQVPKALDAIVCRAMQQLPADSNVTAL
ncbi:MAG: serine/threonine-protein kinase [Planctomycetota bacterium]